MKGSNILSIKQRFGIIGNSASLNHAIEVAAQVAPTDMTVLITGESGSGKESFSKIIHLLSSRKHGKLIAINCGAIPEGTIDSELFGHEKGSFTGAHESRKGYFEVTDGGTIVLDEIAEMPLGTQARLLRVLENGEFIKVGFAAESSNLIENAKKKMEQKKLDIIIANDITSEDSGFGSDNNRVIIIDADGKIDTLPLMSKRKVADKILDRVVIAFNKTSLPRSFSALYLTGQKPTYIEKSLLYWRCSANLIVSSL